MGQIKLEVWIFKHSKNCKIEFKIFILACGALENARIILNNQKKTKLFNNLNTGRYFMDHPRKNLGFLKLKKKKLILIVFME